MNLIGWNQHRVLIGTLVALAAASSFGGCDKLGGGKKDKDKGSATVASGSENVAPQTGSIKIGHYASLTGEEATFGISTDNGVKLAMEERNAAGGVKGRKIELKTLDDGSKATEAGNVVARLINEDKVVALIGEVASSASLAGGKVAQDRGVPMISPSSTNKQVTKGRDMVSRVCFLDEFQGYVVAKFASEKGMKKVAILYDQAAAYSKGLAETFQVEFEALGGKITTKQAYKKGDPDMSAQLQTIKTSGIDAVFLPGYYTDVGNIIRQARKLGIKQPFLGGDGWDS
ncbi:MAG TPA: ABC transporter substrate-binding protein, partial [Kofleriaceae bacterium]